MLPVDESVNVTFNGAVPDRGVPENAATGAVVPEFSVNAFRQAFALGILAVRSVQVVPVLLI
jgi:hypothetical protein